VVTLLTYRFFHYVATSNDNEGFCLGRIASQTCPKCLCNPPWSSLGLTLRQALLQIGDAEPERRARLLGGKIKIAEEGKSEGLLRCLWLHAMRSPNNDVDMDVGNQCDLEVKY